PPPSTLSLHDALPISEGLHSEPRAVAATTRPPPLVAGDGLERRGEALRRRGQLLGDRGRVLFLVAVRHRGGVLVPVGEGGIVAGDRKSTRLNSSHVKI